MATAEEYEKQIVDRTNKMVASANSQFSKYEADQKKKNVKVSKIRLFVDKDSTRRLGTIPAKPVT